MKLLILNLFSLPIYLLPYHLKILLSGILGFFWALGDKKRGVVVIKNLKHSGIKDPNFFDIWRVFRNYLMDLFYFIGIRFMSRKKILSLVSGTDTIYFFDEALKKGKGVILLSPHIGGVEIASAYISVMGYPLVSVAEWKGVGERHYAFYHRLRAKFGTEIFPLEDRKTSFLIRDALEHNKIVALISDRNLTGKGILTDFLQGKMLFPRGPIHFALKFSAPVIVGKMIRKGDKYIAELSPPIYPDDETENSLLVKIKKYMAEIIQENPYMWYTFQSIWEEG